MSQNLVGKKLLFVEAVADALGDSVGIPFEPLVHIVRGEEFLPISEGGIGLHEIGRRALGMHVIERTEGKMLCTACARSRRLRIRSKPKGGERL